ncbi:hypothetical protein MKX01_029038 [Papaver californicum]|nr:hypothetical protein MKX01_029038 [Papaver californicum]
MLAFCNLSPEQKKKLGGTTMERIQVKLEQPEPDVIPVLREEFPPGFDYAYVDREAGQYLPNQRRADQVWIRGKEEKTLILHSSYRTKTAGSM